MENVVEQAVPGSSPVPCCSAPAGRPRPDAVISVSVYLRARGNSRGFGWVNRDLHLAPAVRTRLTRAQLAQDHGAAPQDLDAVRDHAMRHGLSCPDVSADRRRLVLTGPAEAMERAFGVRLGLHERRGAAHLCREGPVRLGGRCHGAVRAVLGLEGCLDLGEANSAHDRQPSPAGIELPPSDSGALGLPEGATGTGITVAVVGVGAGADAAAEAVVLVARAATLRVWRADPGERAVVDALADALHASDPAPDVVVLAFGAPEPAWSGQAVRVVEALLLGAAATGASVVAASSWNAVWFPASAPHATAVAGLGDGPGRAVGSALFPAPTWQDGASAAGAGPAVSRMVPDATVPLPPTVGATDPGWRAFTAAGVAGGVLAAVCQGLGIRVGHIAPALAGNGTNGAPVPGLRVDRVSLAMSALSGRELDASPTSVAEAPVGERRGSPGPP